jgi:acetyltransferase
MAGDYQIHKAALKQAGLLFLDKDGQMGDAVRALLQQPSMNGRRVAVITPTGAGGIMASDALEKNGLELASLSEKTLSRIANLSPEWMPLGNPLDLWPAIMKHGLKDVYADAVDAVSDDPNVDGILCLAIAPELPDFAFLDASEDVNKVLQEKRHKPVVGWVYGPNAKEIGEKFEKEKKVTVFQTIERAAWSLSLLRDRQRFLERVEVEG